MKPKIYAAYLPQYHEIPENSEFWGKGYTDWVAVKKAAPLFKGHAQPKVPLGNVYYDLSNPETIRKQAELARKYGIDGFCIYHYWFYTGKNLLTKPAELLLANKDIDIGFFFAWDNGSWKRTWSKIKGGNDWSPMQDNLKNNSGSGLLVEYKLGGIKDWKAHFLWLLPYFKDERYQKIGGKPIFVFFNYEPKMQEMVEYWDQLAKENGFNGIFFVVRYNPQIELPENLFRLCYQPSYFLSGTFIQHVFSKIHKIISPNKTRQISYDKVWKSILHSAKKSDAKTISGAIVNYDDTPRRGVKGTVFINSSPDKFQHYLRELLKIDEQKDRPFIYLTAWNEWGEGAYLEPDALNQYQYLEAVKKAKA